MGMIWKRAWINARRKEVEYVTALPSAPFTQRTPTAFMPKVVEAQKEVAAARPRTRYVDTAGAETLPPSHTHFTATGTLEVGRRFAEALLAAEQAK